MLRCGCGGGRLHVHLWLDCGGGTGDSASDDQLHSIHLTLQPTDQGPEVQRTTLHHFHRKDVVLMLVRSPYAQVNEM